jgi:hypothetical protein
VIRSASITALTTLALLAPPASALNDGYRGETSAGGLIAVRVDYDHKGNPTKVHSLRWANVPISCGTFTSATTGDVKLPMKVDDRGAFKGSDDTDTGIAKVTISGRFKHNPAKASGKFRVKGTLPGCSTGDTGQLTWEMSRK